MSFYKNAFLAKLFIILPAVPVAALFNFLATLLSFFLLIVFILFAYEKYKNEKLAYEHNYRKWESFWLCLRCGCAFTE